MTGQAPAAAPAPSQEPSAAPTATAAPATEAAPATTTGPTWLQGAPEDISAFASNKGWPDAATAIKSYRELEKHMGVPADKLLRMPDFEKAEKADLDAFFGKLGRPADPAKYDIKLPDGVPEAHKASIEGLRAKFHEAGLTQRQAQHLTDALLQNAGARQQEASQALQTKLTEAEEALKRNWGAAWEKNQTVAANAAEAFGLDENDIKVLKGILGAKATELFYNIGAKMGEDQFIGKGANNGFGTLAPAQAKEEIKRLMNDVEFANKYLAGNTEARSRMEQLHKWAGGVA